MKPLRVLVVEDDPDDFELTLSHLRHARLDVTARRVASERGMREALHEGGWDIILSDYQMPGFGGPQAVALARQLGGPPVIVISGTIGEERATELLHAGASDFIVKGRFARLIPAIDRAMEAAANQRARVDAERELRLQRDALARSNAELQQYAYVAAHDLQEPLRTIAVHLEVVEKRLPQPLDATAARSLTFVIHSAQRMQRMIRELLEYATLGTGAEPIVAVDLGACVTRARALLATEIAAAGAVIESGPLPTVPGRERELTTLLLHLIENALVHRATAPPQIRLRAQVVAGAVELAVTDNGIGIPPEARESVFRMFHRLRPDQGQGSGMGLTICRKIVEQHGGTIRAEAGPEGVGTTIRITLPMLVTEGAAGGVG